MKDLRKELYQFPARLPLRRWGHWSQKTSALRTL